MGFPGSARPCVHKGKIPRLAETFVWGGGWQASGEKRQEKNLPSWWSMLVDRDTASGKQLKNRGMTSAACATYALKLE